MLSKSNKTELNEDFMAMGRDEQTLWDVISLSCQDKYKKTKVW